MDCKVIFVSATQDVDEELEPPLFKPVHSRGPWRMFLCPWRLQLALLEMPLLREHLSHTVPCCFHSEFLINTVVGVLTFSVASACTNLLPRWNESLSQPQQTESCQEDPSKLEAVTVVLFWFNYLDCEASFQNLDAGVLL